MGKIYLITGLPGTGKTTLSKRMHDVLTAQGTPTVMFDADVVRQCWPTLGYTTEDRTENVRRFMALSATISGRGCDVIVSMVAPSKEVRDEFRNAFAPEYTEIYLNTTFVRRPKSFYPEYEEGTPDVVGRVSAYAFLKKLERQDDNS